MSTQIRVVDPCDYPFTKVDNAAITDPKLSIYDSHVYVALCSFASNRTDGAYPSMKTLAERAKCSERQARSSIRVLEDEGYITTQQRRGGVNVYTLTRSKHRVDETPARCAEPGAASHADHPGTPCRRTRLKELDLKISSPTESAQAQAESPDERPVDLQEIPAAMRPVAKYLLHETGRKDILVSELADIRALERIHYPARITQEIDTAVKRFRSGGRDPATLSFGYLFHSLKNQKSRKQQQRAAPPASSAKEQEERQNVEAWEREQLAEIMKQIGGG